ncbi:MAG: FeoB-associated Cys-rich membrane protein [Prevotellaceae bacterium]|nr:FeoB-associated Cys-rich membrane protein [Prevotellaceae bacterium]
MWQEIAIYVVGVGVIAYIISWTYRTFFKKGRPRGHLSCTSCSNCALRDKELYQH